VRELGYATTSEEMVVGMSSVAVPVVRAPDRDGLDDESSPEVVAAIGLVVPAAGRHRQGLVAVLQVAARGIGRQLDSPGPGSR
jgi:DNA-binding IclR family transcriptional regulator